MSDYIFGTLKILKRVTQKRKELITRDTSDRTTIYTMNTTLLYGTLILIGALSLLMWMGIKMWHD